MGEAGGEVGEEAAGEVAQRSPDVFGQVLVVVFLRENCPVSGLILSMHLRPGD